MLTRDRLRSIGVALFRVLLFTLLFVALQAALVTALIFAVRVNVMLLDSISVLVAAVVVGLLLLRALEQQPARALGFPIARNALTQLLSGSAIGIAGLLIACLVLVAIGALRYRSDDGSFAQWGGGMLNMLLVLLIPAAAEEALFRGYPYQKLVAGLGAVAATLLASVLFALAHAGNPAVNGFALVNIFVAGVVLSAAFLRTRSLWFATGVHLGWNWSMAALLDLPVSGLELFDAPLYEPVSRGAAWLSGGAFGPEGGVAGLLGLLLVLAGVWWFTRKTEWATT